MEKIEKRAHSLFQLFFQLFLLIYSRSYCHNLLVLCVCVCRTSYADI
jgi:hypothetical protein